LYCTPFSAGRCRYGYGGLQRAEALVRDGVDPVSWTRIVAQHLGYASSDFAIERVIASRADAITESGKIRP
jgi:hypothetical protein